MNAHKQIFKQQIEILTEPPLVQSFLFLKVYNQRKRKNKQWFFHLKTQE